MSDARSEISQLQSSLAQRDAQVKDLEAGLQQQKQENAGLWEQVQHLQGQLSEAEQALALEQGTSKGLRQELKSMQV